MVSKYQDSRWQLLWKQIREPTRWTSPSIRVDFPWRPCDVIRIHDAHFENPWSSGYNNLYEHIGWAYQCLHWVLCQLKSGISETETTAVVTSPFNCASTTDLACVMSSLLLNINGLDCSVWYSGFPWLFVQVNMCSCNYSLLAWVFRKMRQPSIIYSVISFWRAFFLSPLLQENFTSFLAWYKITVLMLLLEVNEFFKGSRRDSCVHPEVRGAGEGISINPCLAQVIWISKPISDASELGEFPYVPHVQSNSSISCGFHW